MQRRTLYTIIATSGVICLACIAGGLIGGGGKVVVPTKASPAPVEIKASATLKPSPTVKASATPKLTTRPSVAPATSQALPPSTPVACPYVGNSNTGKFHRASCAEIKRMAESNKVCLSSREQAIAQGYIPCAKCNP